MPEYKSRKSYSSPEEQGVTFVELFFDLVFVFSVTQVVGLLHDGITWLSVGQAVLIFWLVWWAWTQFTWALNAADTNSSLVQFGVLLATAVAFFMAVALPDAFGSTSLWFALAYILVRGIGLYLYAIVTCENPDQIAAVRLFSVVSVGGLAAVLVGGILGGEAQLGLWGMAILLDVIAAGVGAQDDGWNLHTDHFGERHGLFVIIALGETLIVAASGATGAEWTTQLALVAALSVVVTCALWWSYFPKAKPTLDEALATSTGGATAPMARDIYSLLHFPMICGIIAYAVAIEHAVSHPTDPFELDIRASLAVGLFLFAGGMILATLRAGRGLLVPRLVFLSMTAAAILLVSDVMPVVSLSIAGAGVMIVVVLEHRTRVGVPI